MRRLALLLLIALIPAQAWAFSPDDLQATIAMPLAVAAVYDVDRVPRAGLADLVTAFNEADVPPAQFVEVIRYVPVALIDDNGRPFVQYVRDQTLRGVTGNALVNLVVDRLRSEYDVSPSLTLQEPATTFVVQDDYIPPLVATRVSTVSYNDPLSLIAMPLAVAAVADITGVSQNQLASLVASLNQAYMPPVQMVEVLRYSPVALVVDNGEPFVQFVQSQTTRGIYGTALVPVIVGELQTYYPPQTRITVAAPAAPSVFTAQDFVPAPVTTRVAEVRLHPHGGPPGQLKKQLGLQTGAEVVHGARPGRELRPIARQPEVVVREKGHGRGKHEVTPPPMISSTPPTPKVRKQHGKGHAEAVPMVVPRTEVPAPGIAPPFNPPGKSNAHAGGGPPGGKHPGKGGGKGHGKD